jgi:hypothetical protein
MQLDHGIEICAIDSCVFLSIFRGTMIHHFTSNQGSTLLWLTDSFPLIYRADGSSALNVTGISGSRSSKVTGISCSTWKCALWPCSPSLMCAPEQAGFSKRKERTVNYLCRRAAKRWVYGAIRLFCLGGSCGSTTGESCVWFSTLLDVLFFVVL